jgi:hypothetical protein
MTSGEQVGLAVARYLRPEEQVVPFWPRPELDALVAWCRSERPRGRAAGDRGRRRWEDPSGVAAR